MVGLYTTCTDFSSGNNATYSFTSKENKKVAYPLTRINVGKDNLLE